MAKKQKKTCARLVLFVPVCCFIVVAISATVGNYWVQIAAKYKEKQESLETELDEANKKIEGFKTLEEDKEKLTKEIETMKKEASEKEFNSALDSALKEFNSKNDKLVKALLDREKITLKDGKLEGIKEQLEEIKKENDFLFEKPVNPIPDFQTGSKHKSDPKPKSIGEKLAEAKTQVTEIKY